MARAYHLLSKNPTVTMAYTVDQAVGPGCPNQRNDVLLVQHLLRLAWADGGGSKGYRPPGETQPLAVDGIYGPKTGKFIKFFQEEVGRRGTTLTKDGRVDPVRSGGSMGSLSATYYTILALNAARNSRQPGNQGDIAKDPGFPVELMKEFYIQF